jgi:predicted metalloprotease with PDZ domain
MRVVPRAVAAILTVLLHLLILSALVRVTASVEKPPQPPAEQETTADKLHGAGEQIISVDISPGLSTNGLACAGSSYIGVGVTAEPGSERIILVGENTPASRAGLQHDDIVLNPGVWRDAHEDGALLRVVVLREGVTMAMSVLVGKICIG